MWYFIDNKYYPVSDETIKAEYLIDRKFNYTNPTPVKDDVFDIIKRKIELFDKEYQDQYLSDLKEFFINNKIRKLSEVKLIRDENIKRDLP